MQGLGESVQIDLVLALFGLFGRHDHELGLLPVLLLELAHGGFDFDAEGSCVRDHVVADLGTGKLADRAGDFLRGPVGGGLIDDAAGQQGQKGKGVGELHAAKCIPERSSIGPVMTRLGLAST